MTRSTGQGSGMMIMVILILLLSSSASAGGGYFYTNREDTKEAVEDEFKKKYQEATRALEAERAAQQNVNVAKSVLELAQEELELARLAFEGKEFANEAEKSAARARLYAAEQDVDTAAFRLSEAETDAQTASTRRDTAEKNANSALEIAITINTMIEANAVADANVMVTLAQGQLDAAERDWARIIGDANAAAANVMIASDAQAYAAYSRLQQAQNNYSTASTNLQTTELELTAAQNREAAALIGAAEKLSADIGAGNSVTCSINDVGGGDGAVYFVDGITNVLRHYPNSDIAASWDPNWATATSIDCVGFALGKDMVKNPAVVAAEAFQAKVDSLGDGTPVRCSANDVGAGQDAAVYRTTGTATLRHYETADIAASWDPNWASAQSIDCIGFAKGEDMVKNPEVVAAEAFQAKVAALGDGNPVRCDTAEVGAGPGAVYRTTNSTTLRHYPSEAIASSWDPDWATTTQGIDCTGFVLGPEMPMEPGAVAAAAAAAAEAAASANAAAPARPVMTTGTGGPHNGGLLWQSHDIGGRFHSPGGLVWLGGNQAGDQPWEQSYKFRCEKDGAVSGFSPTYGPVNFRRYHKPKLRVSDSGTTPCNVGEKLEVWDANTDNNITSLMKNFTGTAAYDGTDSVLWDDRDIGITTPAPTGTCQSKVGGLSGDFECRNLSGWDCANRSTCELV